MTGNDPTEDEPRTLDNGALSEMTTSEDGKTAGTTTLRFPSIPRRGGVNLDSFRQIWKLAAK